MQPAATSGSDSRCRTPPASLKLDHCGFLIEKQGRDMKVFLSLIFGTLFFVCAALGQTTDTARTSNDVAMISLTKALVIVGIVQALVYFFQWLWMVKTLSHTRKSSEQGLRAYVGVMHVAPTGSPAPLPGYFDLWVVNSGQTPAYRVTSKLNWKYFPTPNAAWPANEPYTNYGNSVGSSLTLAPDQPAPVSIQFGAANTGVTFQAAQQQAQTGQITLFIYGTITYQDIYRSERTSDFCFRHLAGTSNGLVVCDHHNDSN